MVVWHPKGELLASCSYDDSIKLWVNDGDDWMCAQTLQGKLQPSVRLAHIVRTHYIVSSNWSCTFCINTTWK